MRGIPALLAVLALSACDRGDEAETADQTVVARTSETELPAWLSPTDGSDPARWLAGREAGHPLPAGWIRLQDHAMRGLVVVPPPDADAAVVVRWALGAVEALVGRLESGRWRAELHSAE